MITTPKGIRRNNPLNLMRTNPRQGWAGALPDSEIDGDREEAFIDPLWGLRAAGIVLLNDEVRRGLWTVREIYTSFAPPNENDTEAYIRNMANWIGVDPDVRMDLCNVPLLVKALKAGIREEDGEQPYPDELIEAAAQAALASLGSRATNRKTP